MFITTGTAMAMKQGGEDKCEVFFKVHLHCQMPVSVTHACNRAVTGRSSADVMMPLVWSATMVCCLYSRVSGSGKQAGQNTLRNPNFFFFFLME